MAETQPGFDPLTGESPHHERALRGTLSKKPMTEAPKPSWAELVENASLGEMLERLRAEALEARGIIRYLCDQAARLEHELHRLGGHSHDAVGQVVVPYREGRAYGVTEAQARRFDPLA